MRFWGEPHSQKFFGEIEARRAACGSPGDKRFSVIQSFGNSDRSRQTRSVRAFQLASRRRHILGIMPSDMQNGKVVSQPTLLIIQIDVICTIFAQLEWFLPFASIFFSMYVFWFALRPTIMQNYKIVGPVLLFYETRSWSRENALAIEDSSISSKLAHFLYQFRCFAYLICSVWRGRTLDH